MEQKSLLNTGKQRYEVVPDDKQSMLVYVKDTYTDERMTPLFLANVFENFEYLWAVCHMYNVDYNLYLDQILGYCFFNNEGEVTN